MLLTPASLWFVEKGRLPGRPAILAINNRSGQQCFAGGEKSAQALFMLFMTMPTIAETIAPDTPPPPSWPTGADVKAPFGPLQHRDERGQERSASRAAQSASDGVARGSEVHILCGSADRGAADGAGNKL